MLSKFEISPAICKSLEDKEWLHSKLKQGTPPRELLGFSNAVMDEFYRTACVLYDEKQYEEAADAFLFLVTLDSGHYDYWIGLGAATQRCEEYELAIDAYEMAAICEIENPIPYFYLAKCLFAIHDRASALQAIELALEYSEGDLHRQAEEAKKMLIREG